MIETLIYTVLTADADVKRRVNTRVYPVVMPQGVTLPAVSYQRISNNPVNHLEGYSGLANPHIIINSWATAYDAAKALAHDVHGAMNAATTYKSVLTNELDGYDPDVGLYVVSQDFSCWGAE